MAETIAISRILCIALVLLAGSALSAEHPAPPAKLPTEVKIVSVPSAPPAQPTEVKIISTPPASPTEIKIVSVPKDDSTRDLVRATWGLLIASLALCGVSVWSTRRQSLDLRRRDRVAMEREINRAAQKNADAAKRLWELAGEIPTRYRQLSETYGKRVPEAASADIEHEVQRHQKAISAITDRSAEILSSDLLNRESKSDREIIDLLWTVDSHELQLQALRDEIARGLNCVAEKERELLERREEMQAFIDRGRP
jgi:hypothetical protein